MAQHDYVIANQSGAAFRADLNNALAAIVSQNSGAAEPSTTYAYMPWADTTNGLFKIRNAANNGWITLYQLDGEWDTIALEDGTALAPSLYFKDSGTDTGIYSPAADNFAITTAGVERVNFKGATEVVFNDGGADVDFRIEGDTKANLFKVDAGTDAVSIDGAFSVTGDATVGSLNGGPLAGTRNRIINGDMRIDQRFGGTAVTYSAGFGYVLDRWNGAATIGSNMRVQQVTDAPAGFTNSLKADALTGATITASDYFSVLQSIEGFSVSDLGFGTASASSVTLSFWVKSSVTGTHSGSVRNSATDRSYPYTYTISSADTWEKKTIVIPGDTSGTWLTTNGVGIQLNFDLGTGSTFRGTAGVWTGANYLGVTGSNSPLATSGATWYITGVQLEAGSVATPFERRNYGQELALCLRYYVGQAFAYQLGNIISGGSLGVSVTLPVLMRANPTLVETANFNGNLGTNTFAFVNSLYVYVYAPGLTVGNAALSCTFTASAEL